MKDEGQKTGKRERELLLFFGRESEKKKKDFFVFLTAFKGIARKSC